MSSQLSIDRVLAGLHGRIEHHKRQEAFHTAQEVFHQQEKVRHAAELVLVQERCEAFQKAAEAVAGLVEVGPEDAVGKVVDDSIPPGIGAIVSRLVARVVAEKGLDEELGANAIAWEVKKRYGDRLKKPVRVRAVAAKLRRMARSGSLIQLREGRAFYEALYRRAPDDAED
ncbi:MAG TPA: hypothetical protein DD490_03455 [Acidobacteria bacterium]|nr:hypothetical protein [Acidobacteriota bacterium]